MESDFDLWQEHRTRLVSAATRGDPNTLAHARETIPRLDHWFDRVAQCALAGAAGYIRELDRADPWRDRLAAAVSSVVVRASRQESNTRYAAIDKKVSVEAFAQWLNRAVDRVAVAANELATHAPEPIDSQVLTGDATVLASELEYESAAAVVFSPPYPNAYEYWLYHKYRMYWLGFDPLDVKANEIGARPFYSGSGRLTEDDFAAQLTPVVAGVTKALKPGGACLIVVGDSIIRGRLVDNGALMREVCTSGGLTFVASALRTIRRTRRSFNLAVARALGEHVLLFTKP
jgi:hypothetical protein